ncbi:transport permease protein [Kocuria dechangensis]|uniref:Transport permease protein n=1 Tax=Kocuria dechangensis TaxID=1176249 RepID=A0A917LWS1_9MICC|nr:ABC transporter permease [Kocuria dechangensis]GGG64009.1 transport permease protein [Kocuria dechangensis]
MIVRQTPERAEWFSSGPPPRTVVFDSSRLQAVGTRPPLTEYLVQLWGSRHFVLYDARVRLSVSQEHTMLGKAWLVLNPALLGLTFLLIFGLLLGTRDGVENFIAFLLVGIMMFTYSSRAIVAGARSMASGRALIRGFSFPRAALPLSINVRDLMSQGFVLVAMIVMVLAIPPLEPISWRWLLLIPIVALQTIFNWGFGMLMAPLVHRIPDVGNLLSFAMRIWMYSSGIFYDPSRFVTDERWMLLFEANPLYQVLSMSRDCLIYGITPEWWQWTVLVVAAFGTWLLGLWVFWRNEESYANER